MENVTEVVQQNVSNNQVVEYSETLSALVDLEKTYGTEVPNIENKEGYERAKAVSSECRSLRLALEGKRKEIKDPYLNMGRMIDSHAKDIKSRLQAIEGPFTEAYQAVDKRKKAELQARKDKISELNSMNQWATDKSPEEIADMMEAVQDTEVSKQKFGRLTDDAAAAVGVAMDQLTQAHGQAIQKRIDDERVEAERIELETLRRQQSEREDQDRMRREQEELRERQKRQEADHKAAAEAARIKAEKEAEEKIRQAKIDAENAERRRAEQEEKARIDAENAKAQAKIDADRAAEQARLQEIERQRLEDESTRKQAEAREANKRHVGKVRKIAVEALMLHCGLTKDVATSVVKAINGKAIPAVTISY